MRKVFLLSILLLFLMSFFVNAEDFQSYGGISYNSYSLDDFNYSLKNNGYTYQVDDSGNSYYVGIREEDKKKINWAVEFEYMTVNWEIDDVITDGFQLNSYGLLGVVFYDVNEEVYGFKFSPYMALAIYFNQLERSNKDRTKSSIYGVNQGMKGGIKITKKIKENISVNTRVGFRYNPVIVSNGEEGIPISMSGLEIGMNVEWAF
ncbi:MAG: hypothetical protein ACOCRK_10690 [bacterium]